MRINTRFTVAVHVLALLALSKDNTPPSERMAESVGNHPVMIRQTMSALKKAGLIVTRPGVPGGKLAKSPARISLLEVYRAVRSKDDALFDVHPRPSELCPVGRNIKGALAAPISDAERAMEKALERYSLKDVTAYILEQESGAEEAVQFI